MAREVTLYRQFKYFADSVLERTWRRPVRTQQDLLERRAAREVLIARRAGTVHEIRAIDEEESAALARYARRRNQVLAARQRKVRHGA